MTKRKLGRKLKLIKRLRIPNIKEEIRLKKKGYQVIAGLDEVGRGALAGPVVAGICILRDGQIFYKVRDSKLLSAKEREHLAKKINKEAHDHAFGIASVSEIEKFGIHGATLIAFERAINSLKTEVDFILVDGYRLPNSKIPHKHIKKGDMLCISIAAASIIAKVYRDNLMKELALKYAGYFFENNKGYGTKRHLEALKQLGPCKIHRRNFRPVKGQK
ncbi:MAG: ribonuclease HII [Candidatus Berkelbacteria bacterium]|nr:ribonuclease HII [Candidatus Berkelbacteria bacterium]